MVINCSTFYEGKRQREINLAVLSNHESNVMFEALQWTRRLVWEHNWRLLTHWSEQILSSSWVCDRGLYISSSSSSSSSLSILLVSGMGGEAVCGVREGWGDPTQLTLPGSAVPFWAEDSEKTGSRGSIPSSTLLWAGAVWLFLIAELLWGSPSSSSSPSRLSSKEIMLVIFFFLLRSFLSPESSWDQFINSG